MRVARSSLFLTTVIASLSLLVSVSNVRLVTHKEHADISASQESLLVPTFIKLNLTQRVADQVGNDKFLSLLHNCSVTSQVKVAISQDPWTLQALDEQGRPKSVGGDEFYVTYTDASIVTDDITSNYTAAALIQDLQNGTYLLDFVTPPLRPNPKSLSESGKLQVHFVYTCGIGRLSPPSKQSWKSGGATNVVYSVPSPRPPLRVYGPPTDIKLESFKQVIVFGDSVSQQLVQKDRKWFLPDGRVYVRGNVGSELYIATVPRFLQKLQQWHEQRHFKDQPAGAVGLILGSSVWDVLQSENIQQGELFKDHLQACRDLINAVRARYPNVTVFWKSPSAMHLHRLENKCWAKWKCVNRVRYMSTSRAAYLHQEQQRLMSELNVPYLNLYDAYFLSSDSTMEGDGRHYDAELNAKMLSYFYYSNTTVRVQD